VSRRAVPFDGDNQLLRGGETRAPVAERYGVVEPVQAASVAADGPEVSSANGIAVGTVLAMAVVVVLAVMVVASVAASVGVDNHRHRRGWPRPTSAATRRRRVDRRAAAEAVAPSDRRELDAVFAAVEAEELAARQRRAAAEVARLSAGGHLVGSVGLYPHRVGFDDGTELRLIDVSATAGLLRLETLRRAGPVRLMPVLSYQGRPRIRRRSRSCCVLSFDAGPHGRLVILSGGVVAL
jgi:hypothetical protein